MLCVSLIVHMPMTVYDLTEFVLFGGAGVVILMYLLNVLNLHFGWTHYGLPLSCVIFAIGLFTHVSRLGDTDGTLANAAPASFLERARNNVKSRSTA